MSRGKAAFSILLAVWCGAGACDDVSPLPYERPRSDAAADHVDLGEVAACRSCATDIGSVCRSAFDACQAADARCGGLFQCLTDTNCWRQLDVKNFTDPPPCADACLGSAQVTSINEIAVPTAQFYQCVVDPARCGPACFSGSPATGGDQ